MLVLHCNWSGHALHLWAEDLSRARQKPAAADAGNHPFIANHAELEHAVREAGILHTGTHAKPTELALLLPHRQLTDGAWPLPSSRMAALLGTSIDGDEDLQLATSRVHSIEIAPRDALGVLLALHQDDSTHHSIELGHETRWWNAVGRLAVDLIADQRVVPSLRQERTGALHAAWQPWMHDGEWNTRLERLIASVPASARAVGDEGYATGGAGAWAMLEDCLGRMVDAQVREALSAETYIDAIEGADQAADPHVAWLAGLLDRGDSVVQPKTVDQSLLKLVRGWIGNLEDLNESSAWRLRFELHEPPAGEEPAADALWHCSFHLADPSGATTVDAEQIWAKASGSKQAKNAARAEEMGALLLAELSRASRIWTALEESLEESDPCGMDLTTKQAYALLAEIRPVLLEAGFDVMVPEWWGQPASRLGARLMIQSGETDPSGSSGAGASSGALGLQSLVDYRWQIAVGDAPISLEAFEALAKQGSPLVRVNGQWVEIRPEDFQGAVQFLREHPGGSMTLVDALRMAHGIDGPVGMPILGMDATGWVAEIFGAKAGAESLQMLEQPTGFQGSLRPYQLAGVSWLAFLDKYRLGAVLADDMGLGKTIQLIALLLHERQIAAPAPVGPTLLVAPMSVLGNWQRELSRFAPNLRMHVQHGLDRPMGERFEQAARGTDVVITTYAIVVRDKELMQRIPWRRVVLDEAQHIKNPPTKQTAAIRSLEADHRVALTGTPVENRLTELWSIMEFCCPGYLGTQGEFRKRFALPVERHRDRTQTERLRSLVRPFVLRRLKTDPKVITDLPPLIETKALVPLSEEQARLYDSVVNEMLAKVDRAEGIQRRGLVLSALVKLKQICNHPAHFLREGFSKDGVDAEEEAGDAEDQLMGRQALAESALVAARSGKAHRLVQLLEEVVVSGHRALVFTQYRQMGHLLVAMLRKELDTEALFLHGGTPQAKRDKLVERFQSEDPSCPVFVLSLKAGGVGLNLTAANYVFHFDRWWNPAVENQATDRAFRIGQSRTVNVHKFICEGTLEERIDQMIEQKTELATQIISAGDQWLTEMSTSQLRDILTLRRSSLIEAEAS